MFLFGDVNTADLIKALEAALRTFQGHMVFETGAVTAVCTLVGSILSGIGIAMWKYIQKITDREDKVKAEAQDAIRKEFKPIISQKDQKLELLQQVHEKAIEAKEVIIQNEIRRREIAEKEISDLRKAFTNETMPLLREVRDVVSRHGDASIKAINASIRALEENDRGNARVVEFYQAIKDLPHALERIERILKEL